MWKIKDSALVEMIIIGFVALGTIACLIGMMSVSYLRTSKCSVPYPLESSAGKYSVEGGDGLYSKALYGSRPVPLGDSEDEGSVKISGPAKGVTLVTGVVNAEDQYSSVLGNIFDFKCGVERQDIYLKVDGEVSRYRVFSVDTREGHDVTPEVWGNDRDPMVKTLVLVGIVHNKPGFTWGFDVPDMVVVKAYQV